MKRRRSKYHMHGVYWAWITAIWLTYGVVQMATYVPGVGYPEWPARVFGLAALGVFVLLCANWTRPETDLDRKEGDTMLKQVIAALAALAILRRAGK